MHYLQAFQQFDVEGFGVVDAQVMLDFIKKHTNTTALHSDLATVIRTLRSCTHTPGWFLCFILIVIFPFHSPFFIHCEFLTHFGQFSFFFIRNSLKICGDLNFFWHNVWQWHIGNMLVLISCTWKYSFKANNHKIKKLNVFQNLHLVFANDFVWSEQFCCFWLSYYTVWAL